MEACSPLSLEELRREDETSQPVDALEEQAAFLTSFQRFYSSKQVRFGKIHPEEIARVLEYRHTCSEIQRMQAEMALCQRNHPTEHPPHPPELVACRSRRTEFEADQRLLHLDLVWERFQVWSTKALAQHLLVAHVTQGGSGQQGGEPTCWSFNLGIPTAAYLHGRLTPTESAKTAARELLVEPDIPPFAQLWNDLYSPAATKHACSLAIVPNIHNYQEFARLAHMMAQLPSPGAVAKCQQSPFCGRANQTMCSSKYEWRSTDLVALWMRAQHDASASRHLTQLFIVRQSQDKTETPTFRATLAGNHRLTYRRVIQESPLVDQIVAYAVLNQVLLTRQKIKQAFQYQRHKRMYPQDYRPISTGPSKRLRFHHADDALDPTQYAELMRACQLQLLRTLASNHRQVLQVAFYKKPSQLYRVLQCSGGCSREERQRLVQQAQRLFRQHARENIGSDRCFMRIARRLLSGCYDESIEQQRNIEEGMQSAFYGTVLRLLESVRELNVVVPASNENGANEYSCCQEALDDWKACYRRFLDVRTDFGLICAARRLLNKKSGYDYEPPQLAHSLIFQPNPWVDRCMAERCMDWCGLELIGTKFRICATCGKAAHLACCEEDGWCSATDELNSHAGKSKWLLKLRTLSKLPDFRGERAKEVRWTMKPFKSIRRVAKRGSLEPYGFTYIDLETCSALFDNISSGEMLVTDYPLLMDAVAYDLKGLLVTRIQPNSLADIRGLRVGDVIVSFECSDMVGHSFDNGALTSNFLHLSSDERKTLVDAPARQTSLIVSRPCQQVLDGIIAWRNEFASMNQDLWNAWQVTKDSWVCHHCQAKKLDDNTSNCDTGILPTLDELMQSYDSCASSVGSSILLLPKDPIVVEIQRELQSVGLVIEDLSRPVELIILAYIPSIIAVDSPGEFFLLPIISHFQLNFLLPLCKPRQVFESTIDAAVLSHWARDGLLDLPGVLKRPVDEVRRLMAQTRQISQTISSQVASLASCADGNMLTVSTSEEIQSARSSFQSFCVSGSHRLGDGKDHSFDNDFLVSDMLYSRVPAMLEMLLEGDGKRELQNLYGGSYPLSRSDADTSSRGAERKQVSINAENESHSMINATRVPVHPNREILKEKMRKSSEVAHYAAQVQTDKGTSQKLLATPHNARVEPESSQEPTSANAHSTTEPCASESVMAVSENNTMVVFPRSLYCDRLEVLYSDLCSIAIEFELYPPHDQFLSSLSEPDRALPYGTPRTITVEKSRDAYIQCGFGWGMEIVKWSCDSMRIYRIGRMSKASDAYKAGIRPNDIVLEVNTKSLHDLTETGQLAATILGVLQEKPWHTQSYKDVMQTLLGRKDIGKQTANTLTLLISQPDVDSQKMTSQLPWDSEVDGEFERKNTVPQDTPMLAQTSHAAATESLTDKSTKLQTALDRLRRRAFPRSTIMLKPIDLDSGKWDRNMAFNVVEMAVLVELCRDAQVLPAFSLLMPPHSIDEVSRHVEYLADLSDEQIGAIPSLSTNLKTYLTEVHKQGDNRIGCHFGDTPLMNLIRQFFEAETAQRIRGGGDLELLDLDRAEWHGTFVSGMCQLSRGDVVNCESLFIGYANCGSSAERAVDDGLNVCVFYLDTSGIIDLLPSRFPVDCLDVVRPDTDEAKIVEKWLAASKHSIETLPGNPSFEKFRIAVSQHDEEERHLQDPDIMTDSDDDEPHELRRSPSPAVSIESDVPRGMDESLHEVAAPSILPEFEATLKRYSRHKNGRKCLTCDLSVERVLVYKEETMDDKDPSYCGCRCSCSLLELCNEGLPELDAEHAACCGTMVKRTLLQLATRIPPSCRCGSGWDASPANFLSEILWQKLDEWKGFVMECRSVASLCQAFIMLLYSVRFDVFPTWYKDGGWSSKQMLTRLESEPALMLHMQVLDLALAEFISQQCWSVAKPPTLRVGPAQEFAGAMADAAIKGRALGLTTPNEHESYCYECEDGGHVLCCEFCSQVCHAACFRPPLDQEPEQFVCSSCLADIHYLPTTSGAESERQPLSTIY